jgi:hypothetical protein
MPIVIEFMHNNLTGLQDIQVVDNVLGKANVRLIEGVNNS